MKKKLKKIRNYMGIFFVIFVVFTVIAMLFNRIDMEAFLYGGTMSLFVTSLMLLTNK